MSSASAATEHSRMQLQHVFVLTLLLSMQLCASPSLPAWLRAGCLAAACHCASGPGLSRETVDQAISATNHVIYSCAHSPEATATLRSFLAAAASASTGAGQVDVWSMVLLQV